MQILVEQFGDFEDCLNKQNVSTKYFTHIIGDNGGICVEVSTGKILFRREIKKDKLERIIEEYIKIGGDISNIRLTNGKNVIAHNNVNAREYYRDSQEVIYRDNITQIEDGMTKLTLTGNKIQIKKMMQFIEENMPGIRVHKGRSTYPEGKSKHFRIDITGNYDKGTAAEELIDALEIDRCIYLGDDLNDVPMFRKGLQNNDFIIVANSKEHEVTESVVSELQEEMRTN